MVLTLLVAALAAPPDPTAGAGPLPVQLRWPALSAVARVTSGELAGSVASAVCVGRKGSHAYLLTAAHVLPKGQARKFEFFTRESYPEPSASFVGTDEEVRLVGPDFVLVKVDVGTKPIPSLPLAGVGQRPKRFPISAVAIGCPGGSPPVFRTESLTAKKWVRRDGVDPAFFWETAVAPVGGMSGGPLLDAAGRVIGVCSAAHDGHGYFAHLDEIQAGLKLSGLEWLFASSSEKQPP